MFAQKKDIANSTDTLNEIKEEKESLEKEKENLQDPNFVENYARGKYMATKDGEQVFILPDDNQREEGAQVPSFLCIIKIF